MPKSAKKKKPAKAGKGQKAEEMPAVEEEAGKQPAAAEEKGEKEGKEAAKKKMAKKQIDVKLAAAIALIAVISISAFFLMQPRQADVSDFWKWNEPADEKLKMIIVYSDRCTQCEVNNSLEMLFAKNSIPYAVNKLEENSAEAQQIIRDLNLIKLPAFLIDGRTIKDSWTVETKSGIAKLRDTLLFYVNNGKAEFEKNVFVFYELSLDNGPHVNMLLGEACGAAEQMEVFYFADPYDPATIATSADMETLMNMFKDYNVEFVYAYLPTASESMEQMFTEDTVETAAKHLVCASGLGTEQFNALQQAFYNKYCDVNAIEYRDKLNKCSDGNHFGTPLLGEEVMAIIAQLGLKDNEQFNSCLYNYKDAFAATKILAAKWQIDKTPTVLVNCTFETHPALAHNVICSYIPDALFCRT